MQLLVWWLRIVGVLYLFVLGALLPYGTGPSAALPGIPFEQQYAQRMEDWQFFFGLGAGVLGAMMLYASNSARESLVLVWVVIAESAVVGAFGTMYYIYRGAPAHLYGLVLLAHLLIVASGIDFARRAMRRDDELLEADDAVV